MAPLLPYEVFSRKAFIKPTSQEEKYPLWSCPDCDREENFACRLACFCGYRPGKSHEDKAWHAHRKAQAVPNPWRSPQRQWPAWSEGNAWQKPRSSRRHRGGEKNQEAPDGEMAKLRAQLAKLERDSVPIERLRSAIEASEGISAQDLLKEFSGSQGGGPKQRKPPRHELEAERRKNAAARKVEKTTQKLAQSTAELAKLQESIRETEAKLAAETAELEQAKLDQKQMRIDQLTIEDNSSLVCVAPPDLAGDTAYEQARERFAAEVASIQAAKAQAAQETGMRDVGPHRHRDSPPATLPAADPVPQPFSEADLLKAGLAPDSAKHTAAQLAEQFQAAGGRGRSRSRSRG